MAEAMRVVSLESRRSDEMIRLLARYGLDGIAAPSMREVALQEQSEALAFGEVLLRGECDFLVLLTGVGLRALIDVLATRYPTDEVIAALAAVPIACRGPKPVAVLKEHAIKPAVVAPSPNTSRELIAALAGVELSGKRVYVQEYGRENHELRAALVERGALVSAVSVYAWRLPEDLEPLERGIALLASGGADALVVTSAQQLQHVASVAERAGHLEALRAALAKDVLVASIGPVTSDALREHGIAVDLEPEHPKMGHLVKALAEQGPALLARKRASATR